MKRLVCLVLVLSFVFVGGISIFAENGEKTEAENYSINEASIEISAKSAVLMEGNTGKIIYAKNESEALSPASVTKIMTLLLVMEALDDGAFSLADKVNVSAYAASMGGSQVFLKEGEEITVEDLIKCTVIASANDAAVALAELVCGSESAFVGKMNKRAGELGMVSAKFENVTGLDDTAENHLLSALDIAIMSRELLKHGEIKKYTTLWQDTIRDGEFTLTNTNRLVRFYDGCTGLKTGSTAKAGFCMSATAERNGMELIAVIMGSDTRDERNAEARALLDYGFSNYALYRAESSEIGEIKISGGSKESVKLYSKEGSFLVNKGDLDDIKKQINLPSALNAPVSKDEKLGAVEFFVGDKLLGECEIYSRENVGNLSFYHLYLTMLKKLLGRG